MRNLFVALLVALAIPLAACTSTPESAGRFRVDIKPSGQAYEEELRRAAISTIEQRLGALTSQPDWEEFAETYTVSYDGQHIVVNDVSAALIDALTERLNEPFSLSFMHEVPPENADLVVADTKGFNHAGLTEEHLIWLTVVGKRPLPGTVTFQFSEAGQEVKQGIFTQFSDQDLGVFVRGRPIYRFRYHWLRP